MMPAQLRVIAYGLLVLALLCAGVALYQEGQDAGRDAERGLWLKQEAARKDAELAAVVRNGAENAAVLERQNQINVKVSTAHENENTARHRAAAADRADADARGGLRIPAPAAFRDCPAAATETADAGRPDESAPATVRLPRELEESLWARAELADTLSAQIRAMQAWVRANGFYGTQAGSADPLLDRMVADTNQMPEGTP